MKFDPRIMFNSDLDPKIKLVDALFLITVLFDKLNIDFTEEETI